ncbi:MAG: GFA family protein [Myxococcota bacterium]|nr:GFA family protein [Myxococcota bacterium]
MQKTFLKGGCHCGAVQFEFVPSKHVIECNCSICTMSGFVHCIVPQSDFVLLKGSNVLRSYRFNTETANHLFCEICGVKSYYYPRSHPDSVSINLRCVADGGLDQLDTIKFDGRNWEKEIHQLRSKSH